MVKQSVTFKNKNKLMTIKTNLPWKGTYLGLVFILLTGDVN